MVMVTLESFLLLANAIFAFIEFVIGLRVILKLFGANAAAPFANWVYETSAPLLIPFQGLFPTPRLTGGFVIEFSALFALLVYAFISYALTELVSFVNHQALIDRSKNRKRAS
ncbi:hypothetical protein A3G67_03690 [Candidatus Roizmanbacteria bacterium RIFCSPLOWO2_12_FULL_40_12]|uniref:YggT family protein n=1 Tax=Candidatus Roizmanbacteria bacterium RIFCSPLOWO2_01_FULL_40_42 TaxID=1802066 RepID=A0A1F7J5N4_9BACT|nr:MAG: hypothetical protein A2779_03325 [Candidatus Roizmanbacteria bacterium RIFCSPHIGHO2_01_FULL_40_98]OGK28369.1 MAG: hypothetical protein A3C31_00690 [Candidatus Roizmanbacteria bacterium RIFCSPHIGHO2_02_FULL_40_53]OGK30605.1 MAG: hypothetical protein A2W49_03375 [Candidatus Roizmanbacteria bacterium RIFCSPHIGHO2_12_41_18]OGK37019.1 MAG: hypothetical protein A3E69_00950 [Candidatus Roizmanbacteria bacterium RIFCSPHIGHO2_12_FULL_40_130]OGK50925.1 MAG: hypothetical protein A3B50_01460 [Candi